MYVSASVRPCVDLVNTIETKSLCVSSANLADMFTDKRMNPIDFGHVGHTRDSERMDHIDF